LAVAAAHIGQQLQKNGQTFGLESLLLNRATIEAVVVLAGLLEMIIANDPKFPVNAEQLIRFRLT